MGLAVPGSLTLLTLCFGACLLVLAGMPPLAGFVGKFAILAGMLAEGGMQVRQDWAWAFMAVLIVSGLATMIGLTRVGVQVFWTSEGDAPKVWALEIGPVVGLLLAICAMTIEAEDVMNYMEATSRALHSTPGYTEGVSLAPRIADQPEGTE